MHFNAPALRRRKLSLTPLIDVVFILLVFFMLASDMARKAQVTLALGKEGTATTQHSDKPFWRLHVGELTLQLNGQSVTQKSLFKQLRQRIATGAELPSIELSSGADVTLQRLLSIYEALQTAGIKNLKLTGATP